MKTTPNTPVAAPPLVGRGSSPPRLVPAAALRLFSDERLARLTSGGDNAAFEAIFARYHQPLYRYCLMILREPQDASDAVQSAMVNALHALQGRGRTIALKPWLYRIAHNEAITLVRRRAVSEEGPPAARWLDVEEHAELRARVGELLGDLRELPDRQRGALVMRELAGLEYVEIAAALDTSPAAAKQVVYEGRRTLHELARGRAMACDAVRAELSAADRRGVYRAAIRAHLRACSECREFRAAMRTRRRSMAAVVPVMPAAPAARVLSRVLAGAGSGGGSGGLAGLGLPALVKSLGALAVALSVGSGMLLGVQPEQRSPVRVQRAAPPVAPARHAAAQPRHRSRHARHAAHARPAARPVSLRARPRTRAGAPAPRVQTPERTHAARPAQVYTDAPAPPAPAPPATPQRRHPLRHVLTGGDGDGGPVRHTVQTVRDTAGAAVGHVQHALPHPPLPHLPIARKRGGRGAHHR